MFLGIVIYFARKPAKNFALSNHENFKKQVENANKAKQEAEQKIAEVNSKLGTLKAEVAEIHQQAEAAARREAEKIVEEGHRQAEQLKSEAKRVAALELAQAQRKLRESLLKNLKSEVSNKISSDTNESGHRIIINKAANQLGALIREAN